ncbi:hypothetical protein F442_08928 [Phytophthora nicotianae P10297]|uniref:Uncharacterized protein n=1 Tax=Phytophthora nicotianae P10297 TaxID=1317064 RepID=W2ZBV8_PHYNI|nr:hypothetical protein F442_08928 [Phytophthora nicotianae P10297]
MKKQGLKYDVVVITIAPNYGNSAGVTSVPSLCSTI